MLAPYFLTDVVTPSCGIINVTVGRGPDRGAVQDANATQNFQGRMSNCECNSGLDYSQPWDSSSLTMRNDTPYLESLGRSLDDRIFVPMVDLHYIPVNRSALYPDIWVNNLTALLCKASYSVDQYRVDYTEDTRNSHIELVSQTNDTLNDFFPGDISKSVSKVFSDEKT